MTNSFSQAVKTQTVRTENGMKAYAGTGDACVSLFYAAGASRGKDITPAFAAAYQENPEMAVRIALHLRDIRQGSGERQLFKTILNWLEAQGQTDTVLALIPKIVELGRVDDGFCLTGKETRAAYLTMLGNTIRDGQLAKQALAGKSALSPAEKQGLQLKMMAGQLVCKWMPRERSAQSKLAFEIRQFFGLDAKSYRKQLVEMTNVVENLMCAGLWNTIDFSKVPSVAGARYKKAFKKNAEVEFTEYVAKLTANDPSVRVNSGAVYPYDVIKGWNAYQPDRTILDFMDAQWDALPNYVGDASILPLVDVSGSMDCPAGGDTSVTCLDVALSLGLYTSQKNTGVFKDMFLTFSTNPELLHLTGTVTDRLKQMNNSEWDMSTDIVKAFAKILQVAKDGKVPASDMPKILCIFSDMQMNECIEFGDSAMESMARQYEAAGYEVPRVVFWNLKDKGNVPVKSDENGVALVSGFSPALLKTILAADPEQFTPAAMMRSTVCVPRYDF